MQLQGKWKSFVPGPDLTTTSVTSWPNQQYNNYGPGILSASMPNATGYKPDDQGGLFSPHLTWSNQHQSNHQFTSGKLLYGHNMPRGLYPPELRPQGEPDLPSGCSASMFAQAQVAGGGGLSHSAQGPLSPNFACGSFPAASVSGVGVPNTPGHPLQGGGLPSQIPSSIPPPFDGWPFRGPPPPPPPPPPHAPYPPYAPGPPGPP